MPKSPEAQLARIKSGECRPKVHRACRAMKGHVSVEDCAKHFGVSVETVRKHIAAGKIPAVLAFRRWHIPSDFLQIKTPTGDTAGANNYIGGSR